MHGARNFSSRGTSRRPWGRRALLSRAPFSTPQPLPLPPTLSMAHRQGRLASWKEPSHDHWLLGSHARRWKEYPLSIRRASTSTTTMTAGGLSSTLFIPSRSPTPRSRFVRPRSLSRTRAREIPDDTTTWTATAPSLPTAFVVVVDDEAVADELCAPRFVLNP